MNRAATIVALALLLAPAAFAFKLQAIAPPGIAETDRQGHGFMSLFGSDVHERITRQAYAKAGVTLADDVIAGVRWNDSPPAMRLGPLAGTCDFTCWASMLRVDSVALEVLAKREQAIPALRSHFGDMQFLHAMAALVGEAPADTREKAMRWLEFSYRVARGEIGARANVFELREAGSTMDPATREWVSSLFSAPEKRLWRVQDVFLPGGGDLKFVAFGSFLHLVEDSYSASHVRRAQSRLQANGCPGYDAADAIVAFHSYVGQDAEKHAVCDDAPDWLESPRAGSPADVLAELVRAYADGRDWPFVRAIVEERVLRLAPAARPADTGACFESVMADPNAPPLHPVALEAGCTQR